MIPTNQFQILFDHDAIAQRFLILETKRDNGNYYRSLVPDLALQVGRALSVAYARGACCYILYERENANLNFLKTELEQQASDVCLREISSVEMAQKQSYLLAQLLCNAMPALSVDGQMYHILIACPGHQLEQTAAGIQHQVVDGDECRIKHQQHRQLFHKRSAVKQQHKKEEQKHGAEQASRVIGVYNGVGQKTANQKRNHFQNQRLPKGKKGL